MQAADLFIKERSNQNGDVIEETWVALRRANGEIVRKLRYRDYERIAKNKYPLKNKMLLHLYNYRKKDPEYINNNNNDIKIKNKIMTRIQLKKMTTGIKVTSIDKNCTYKPDMTDRYFHFYFHLSEEPSDRWLQLFTRLAELHKSSENSRYVWIEGEHIAIRCTIKELRAAYLSDIKELVKATNLSHRKHLESMMADGVNAGIDKDSLDIIAKHMFNAKTSPS